MQVCIMIFQQLSRFHFKLHVLFKCLSYFSKSAIIFKPPSQANILVYDSTNKEMLKQTFGEHDYHFLDVRGESINVLCLLQSFFCKGNRKEAYIDIYIKHVNPKVVLTYIDNNIYFYKIKSRHPMVHTIFLQNGLRSYYGDVFEHLDKLPSKYRSLFHVDTMLVYGDFIGAKYKEYISGNTFVVGSAKNNNALSLPNQSKDQNTIVFISQYCSTEMNIAGRRYSPDEYHLESDRFVIKLLTDYLQNKSKHLIIIKRYPPESPNGLMEDNYFNSMIDQRLHFFYPSSTFTSYQATDSAHVSITIDSTLGYESLARGNRAVFFSVRSHFTGLNGFEFAWPGNLPEIGFCWSNIPDKKACFHCLDFAFTSSDTEWNNAIKNLELRKIMGYDPSNNNSQRIISSLF